MTAFENYLLKIPRPEAIDHIIECLKSPDGGDQAWALMERVHGRWSCTPEELRSVIAEALTVLALEAKEELS